VCTGNLVILFGVRALDIGITYPSETLTRRVLPEKLFDVIYSGLGLSLDHVRAIRELTHTVGSIGHLEISGHHGVGLFRRSQLKRIDMISPIDRLFVKLRDITLSIPEEAERAKIVVLLDELESAQRSRHFFLAYQNFIESITNYQFMFEYFMPRLKRALSRG
jgi:hypothetical protein